MRSRDMLKLALDQPSPIGIKRAMKGAHKGEWEVFEIFGLVREVLYRGPSHVRALRYHAQAKFDWQLDNAGLRLIVADRGKLERLNQ